MGFKIQQSRGTNISASYSRVNRTKNKLIKNLLLIKKSPRNRTFFMVELRLRLLPDHRDFL
jgi:hypothetical protein